LVSERDDVSSKIPSIAAARPPKNDATDAVATVSVVAAGHLPLLERHTESLNGGTAARLVQQIKAGRVNDLDPAN
jgi:hypothetical protein